jgi:hypothetical protein
MYPTSLLLRSWIAAAVHPTSLLSEFGYDLLFIQLLCFIEVGWELLFNPTSLLLRSWMGAPFQSNFFAS